MKAPNPTTLKALAFVGVTIAVHYTYKNVYKPTVLQRNHADAAQLAELLYSKQKDLPQSDS